MPLEPKIRNNTIGNHRPTLGLCMLARDAAATIEPCLRSVAGLVDRIVVVDTGSRDSTVEIATACGAEVLRFAWGDDFAAARNHGLETIGTEWVLVLDADEELPPEAHTWIRSEIAAPRADAYITPVRNYMWPWEEPQPNHVSLTVEERHPRAPEARFYAHSEVSRLFRLDPRVRYRGAVHEQIEYALLELGRPPGRAGFFIHHFGWYLIEPARLERKRAMYLNLLEQKHRERPQDLQVLLQYGDSLLHWADRAEEATTCFLRATRQHPENPEAWMHLAEALLKRRQPEAALVAMGQVRLPPASSSVGREASLRGDAFAGLRRWDEARRSFEMALRHAPGSVALEAKLALMETFTGDRHAGETRMQRVKMQAAADAGHSPSSALQMRCAELHLQTGQWEQAVAWLERTVAAARAEALPRMQLEANRLLVPAAVACGDLATAACAAGAAAALEPSPRAMLRHAAILRRAGRSREAASVLDEAVARYPEDSTLQEARGECGGLVRDGEGSEANRGRLTGCGFLASGVAEAAIAGAVLP